MQFIFINVELILVLHKVRFYPIQVENDAINQLYKDTNMEMLSGAEMVVRSLQDEGIEHIFGYPGGSVLDIYDAIFQSSEIEHFLVRHEQEIGRASCRERVSSPV